MFYAFCGQAEIKETPNLPIKIRHILNKNFKPPPPLYVVWTSYSSTRCKIFGPAYSTESYVKNGAEYTEWTELKCSPKLSWSPPTPQPLSQSTHTHTTPTPKRSFNWLSTKCHSYTHLEKVHKLKCFGACFDFPLIANAKRVKSAEVVWTCERDRPNCTLALVVSKMQISGCNFVPKIGFLKYCCGF